MRQFTEEQIMFRDAYRKFLETEIAPHVEKWREQGIVDREAFEKAGAHGFLMIWPDERYGGLGDRDFRYEQIIIEESARAGTGEWFNTLHSRLVGPYFDHFGTDEQKQRWLPDCVSGKKILAIAMTEPDAGSDLAGMRTTLLPDGDDYVLNGSKTYISNGINADLVIVAGKSDPENNPHAMTLCVVERGMEGFERGRNLDKMGMKAQDTAELFFNNVRIPKENVLGEVGHGFFYLMQGLAEERLIGAVGSAINARRAFDLTRNFVMERKVFGKPLSNMQNTQFKMAEMDAEIDLVQTYVDHCVAEHNEGRLSVNMAAKAKLQATEIEWRMLDLGVQLHGGSGYMKEYPICTMFTDARINRILAGSSEIMKLIIGRDIFSERYSSLLD
ncbi:MAG: acyl-CoA dehydrogenase [Haliea sp.]|jgi:acyl-CoA dehydrogenase|uniref:acyl-CoA dehydrogenase family protein n=1 Tax=Haliea sp. TaxID=1932666 RepID=UPI000C5D4A18|nr:acyl-CoA dehydrogenase family protein [Haliea sp.]MBM69642.1 acyl-CoA dehydrogenase [Haliea sp.]|tara:strand:+ start:33947 stop:35107 length:1161 start_codon:yes stop_codon:yes gene_type:complete